MVIPRFNARTGEPWLHLTVEAVRHLGCAIVEDVLGPDAVEATAAALYRVQDAIHAEIGKTRLDRAGELGVLRLMMLYDDDFFGLLAVPEMLALVDAVLSPTATLHLQNGFILPSFKREAAPRVFQNQFHQDFRRVLNGSVVSLNVFFAISAFTEETGATRLVPGTHQKVPPPDPTYLAANAVAAHAKPGTMIVFDSTLWHCAGDNLSGEDRLGINHQFTHSYLKQQLDYPRALGEARVKELPARTQQLLGFYTRVPASLDEYYRPADQRLYRAGQG